MCDVTESCSESPGVPHAMPKKTTGIMMKITSSGAALTKSLVFINDTRVVSTDSVLKLSEDCVRVAFALGLRPTSREARALSSLPPIMTELRSPVKKFESACSWGADKVRAAWSLARSSAYLKCAQRRCRAGRIPAAYGSGSKSAS